MVCESGKETSVALAVYKEAQSLSPDPLAASGGSGDATIRSSGCAEQLSKLPLLPNKMYHIAIALRDSCILRAE